MYILCHFLCLFYSIFLLSAVTCMNVHFTDESYCFNGVSAYYMLNLWSKLSQHTICMLWQEEQNNGMVTFHITAWIILVLNYIYQTRTRSLSASSVMKGQTIFAKYMNVNTAPPHCWPAPSIWHASGDHELSRQPEGFFFNQFLCRNNYAKKHLKIQIISIHHRLGNLKWQGHHSMAEIEKHAVVSEGLLNRAPEKQFVCTTHMYCSR